MASVEPAELKKFILGMLKEADLSTLSSKMIRKRCEEKFKADMSSRKKEIDDIVMAFVEGETSDKDDYSSDQADNVNSDDNKSYPTAKSDSSDLSDSDSEPCKSEIPKSTTTSKTTPASKNSVSHTVDDDEALAKQLQEEEWNLRSRPSRRACKAVKRSSNKKTKGENKEKKGSRGTSLYSKKCVLSPELAEMMETDEMARSDVVKRLWSYVRERDLFDPSNKQFAICDDQLFKVFKKKRIKMFTIMKHLRNHVKDLV